MNSEWGMTTDNGCAILVDGGISIGTAKAVLGKKNTLHRLNISRSDDTMTSQNVRWAVNEFSYLVERLTHIRLWLNI
jgi:hypothetical protein